MNALIDEMDEFFSSWCERLRHEIELLEVEHESESDLQQRIDAFEEQKCQWEALRRREAQRIQDSSDHLTAAWLHLETEQRRVLQSSQRAVAAASSAPVSPGVPLSPGAAAGSGGGTVFRSSAAADADQPLHRTGAPTLASACEPERIMASPARSREAADRQFRRLRQEIGAVAASSGRL